MRASAPGTEGNPHDWNTWGHYIRYVAYIVGGRGIVKFHNMHIKDDNSHHRVYHPLTGDEILYERLERYQFPTFSEVLDEIELVVELFGV